MKQYLLEILILRILILRIDEADKCDRIGLVCSQSSSETSIVDEYMTFENINVFMSGTNILTLNPNSWSYFSMMFGSMKNATFKDCNLIVTSKIDILINSQDTSKTSNIGLMCGSAGKACSFMACSVNVVGAEVLLNANNQYRFALLCARVYSASSDSSVSYVKFYNNTFLLKDSQISLKTDPNAFGFVNGSKDNSKIYIENCSVFNFTSNIFESEQFSGSNFEGDNNKVYTYTSDLLNAELIHDQIYGLTLTQNGSNKSNVNGNNKDDDNTYWKKVYYIYYEGDTRSMNCVKYSII